MKTKKQAQRDARELFRLCFVGGSLDESRVRQVVGRLVDGGPARLSILTRFQRLVRLDREAHSARVESAAPLTADERATIEAGVIRRYGSGIATSFDENPALIGGVRIKVGSNVHDGSIRGRLAALVARF